MAPRKHLPALPPEQMGPAMVGLARLNLPAGVKQRIALMLLEAANTDRHNVDRLDGGRAADRKATAAAVTTHFRGVIDKAAVGLAAMSDAEWDALVAEANGG